MRTTWRFLFNLHAKKIMTHIQPILTTDDEENMIKVNKRLTAHYSWDSSGHTRQQPRQKSGRTCSRKQDKAPPLQVLQPHLQDRVKDRLIVGSKNTIWCNRHMSRAHSFPRQNLTNSAVNLVNSEKLWALHMRSFIGRRNKGRSRTC